MAEKDKQTDVEDSQGGDLLPVGPEADDEPQPVDVDHEHSIKVEKRMQREMRAAARQEERQPEDVGDLRVEPVDVDHEHSLIQEAMVESRPVLRGTTQDGLEGEPSHREGEVWESMAPEDDELGGGRRRVRVQAVSGGEVTAVNLVTGVVSHFQAENLVGPRWRRAHS